MPGSPKIVTSWARRSRTARANAFSSSSSSSSRPTYGATTLSGRPIGRSVQMTRHTSHAVAEALERTPDGGLRDDAVGRQPVRRRADQDLPRLGRLLETGGDVQRLARGEGRVAVLDDHLARLDPDPHRKLAVAGLDDRDGRAHGPLGVVLVRGRDAEDGEDGVAGELLDRAPVAVDVRRGRGRRSRSPAGARSPGRCAETSAVESTRSTNIAVASLRSMHGV